MVNVGKYNTLKVIKTVDFGLYLDGGEGKEILLPTRYVPKEAKPGDEIEVFIYHDNEGRLIATTARPYATVGEFQFMEVKDVNKAGAFQGAKEGDANRKMVFGVCSSRSCDRTHHGLRSHREVPEQCHATI